MEDVVKNVRAYVTAVVKATTKKTQNQQTSERSAFDRMLRKRQGRDKIREHVLGSRYFFPDAPLETAITRVVLSSSQGPGITISDAID